MRKVDIVALIFLLGACGATDDAPDVGAGLVDTTGEVEAELPPRIGTAAIQLRDVTAGAGVSTAPGGGVAFGDFDDDGRPDLLAAAPDGLRLFRNRGDGTFADWTYLLPQSIGGTGAVFADVDDDGDLDALITHHSGPTLLLQNEPPLGFVVGDTLDSQFGHGAAFADVDGDGDLDFYVAIGRGPESDAPLGQGGAPNQLWINQDGAFTEMAVAFGVGGGANQESWQPVFADFDSDGDPDLLVTEELAPDSLYLNAGAGQPFEDASSWFSLGSTELMGAVVADFNGDGWLDVYATDFPADKLLLGSNGALDNVFTERLDGPDPTVFHTGWGNALADLDSDGDLDLVATAGFHSDVTPPREGSVYVLETSANGRFTDVSDTALALEPPDGQGLATADYDRDGDLDVAVISDALAPDRRGLILLRNDGLRAEGNRSLEIELRQAAPNRRAVGAEITAAGVTRLVSAGESFRSAHDHAVFFGLGNTPTANVTVRWPDGTTDEFEALSGAVRITRGQGATPRESAGHTYDAPPCTEGCPACDALCDRLTTCDFLGELGVATTDECRTTCAADPVVAATSTCAVDAADCPAVSACFGPAE